MPDLVTPVTAKRFTRGLVETISVAHRISSCSECGPGCCDVAFAVCHRTAWATMRAGLVSGALDVAGLTHPAPGRFCSECRATGRDRLPIGWLACGDSAPVAELKLDRASLPRPAPGNRRLVPYRHLRFSSSGTRRWLLRCYCRQASTAIRIRAFTK